MVKYLDVINAKCAIWTNRLKSFARNGEIIDVWDIIHVANAEMVSGETNYYCDRKISSNNFIKSKRVGEEKT